ncbi:MAG: type II toxin-antitoxin system VapC family toxin [Gemmatimonadetes bacterium]|nr:type II toxin-antitoxin system VapC family toxin [Gemmatimonadota bacterium]
MFILDTNIVSEFMRERPHPAVLHWLDDRMERDLFVAAVTQAEVLAGIALLPRGKRRQGLAAAADRAFDGMFADRVLPFDRSAARAYAGIATARRRVGRPISQADCQIAAIAAARGGTLVTRNIRDFEGTGAAVVNPWEDV